MRDPESGAGRFPLHVRQHPQPPRPRATRPPQADGFFQPAETSTEHVMPATPRPSL